ncbi:MAG TPA: hypothetical protein VHL09_05825 [Dehalococcoidia bacterium]|nr:hypothetical protein [Dehalococcoidia bacterium]
MVISRVMGEHPRESFYKLGRYWPVPGYQDATAYVEDLHRRPELAAQRLRELAETMTDEEWRR